MGAGRVICCNRDFLSERSRLSDTLEKINQSVWELQQKLENNPDNHALRKDLVKFFHESRLFIERKAGVPEKERSFLMLQEREAICCFLIHGTGGTPDEMRFLADSLYSQGYTVYAIRLPIDPKSVDSGFGDFLRGRFGNGNRKGNNGNHVRNRSTWSVSLSQSEVVLDTLLSYSKSTYVIGMSFGGTLALNLLRKFPVKGTILISPGLFPTRSNRYLFFRLWQKVLPSLAKEIAPVKTTIIELIEKTRSEFAPVNDPILVIQAVDDPVISSKGLNFLKRHSTNPKSKFVWLRDGGHVLIRGSRAEEVAKLCADFIKKV